VDRRTQISLAAAIGLHAVALVAARRCVSAPVAAPRLDEHAAEIDVETLTPEPSGEPSEAPGSASEQAFTSPVRPPATRASRAQAADVATSEGSRVAVPEAAPVAPSPSAAPVLSLAQLGLEGPNRFMGEPAVPNATVPAEAADGVRRSIAEALLTHDRGEGLGSEGPAVAAIEKAVYESAISVKTRAVLSVVADADGAVTGVSCVDGTHSEWDELADEIAKALQGKRLRKPPGGRGVAMRIEVTSREELPSGRDPGLEVRALGLPVKRGRGPSSTRVDILNIEPKVVIDLPDPQEDPSVGQAAPVRFPRAHIQVINLFGLSGDLVDVGAAARRVVHARVLDEHAL
jgi:hypothetical protein